MGMNEIDVNALFTALRPENVKKEMKKNNGKCEIKLSDYVRH